MSKNFFVNKYKKVNAEKKDKPDSSKKIKKNPPSIDKSSHKHEKIHFKKLEVKEKTGHEKKAPETSKKKIISLYLIFLGIEK